MGFATTAIRLAASLGCSSRVPRSQLFGRTFVGNRGCRRQIALTYDDGPNDAHTLDLLEVLNKHGIKATFFMIGRHVALRPKIAEAVARDCHVIGNHTFSHTSLVHCSPQQIRQELEDCSRALEDVVGEHSCLFRPPHGARRPDVLHMVRRAGLVPVMWSVTAYDWNAESSLQIEDTVVRHVKGGDIVLMHDGSHLDTNADRSQTVIATDRLIRRYRDQGFSFLTVPEMMAAPIEA